MTVSKKPPGKSSRRLTEFEQPKKRREFTVLLVVDDQAERDALVETLKQQKLVVRDYMTAMEFYRDFRETTPGILIMEARLRGMTGIELQEKLIAEEFELPIVLIAGHADAPVAVRAMTHGAFDFLVKPIRQEALIDTIARSLPKSSGAQGLRMNLPGLGCENDSPHVAVTARWPAASRRLTSPSPTPPRSVNTSQRPG